MFLMVMIRRREIDRSHKNCSHEGTFLQYDEIELHASIFRHDTSWILQAHLLYTCTQVFQHGKKWWFHYHHFIRFLRTLVGTYIIFVRSFVRQVDSFVNQITSDFSYSMKIICTMGKLVTIISSYRISFLFSFTFFSTFHWNICCYSLVLGETILLVFT